MDFTIRLVLKQLLGSFSGFVQALVWQAVIGVGGGAEPLFVQNSDQATLSLQVLCVTDRSKSVSAQIQWENI